LAQTEPLRPRRASCSAAVLDNAGEKQLAAVDVLPSVLDNAGEKQLAAVDVLPSVLDNAGEKQLAAVDVLASAARAAQSDAHDMA
jgi:ribosomal protein L14